MADFYIKYNKKVHTNKEKNIKNVGLWRFFENIARKLYNFSCNNN